jgi:predicted transcriptional regulator
MSNLEVKLKLSDEVLEYLQREAERRQVSIDTVVSDVLEDYFEDPTDEEIAESIREGMKAALEGRTRPAREVLEEIRREQHADQS